MYTKGKFNSTVPTVADGQFTDLQVDNNGNLKTTHGAADYEHVAAAQTDQVLGATGATGDLLEGLVCVVTTAATAQVLIQDGAGTAIEVLPNNPGGGIGTYYIPLSIRSTGGAWSVTTGAGVAVLATGNFT